VPWVLPVGLRAIAPDVHAVIELSCSSCICTKEPILVYNVCHVQYVILLVLCAGSSLHARCHCVEKHLAKMSYYSPFYY